MADQQPIIVKKVKKVVGGHHGGSWKVAFADFMTAMMAFFLVMWILGLDQETRSLIAGYFQDPFNFQKEARGNSLATILNQNDGEKGGDQGGVSDGHEAKKRDGEIQEITEIEAKVREAVQSVPELKGQAENVELQVTDEGLSISLMEGAGSVFFETGSAVVRPVARKLFLKLGSILQASKHSLIIDGHTDAKQYAPGATYDNWNLSQDRAQSTLDVMREGGLTQQFVLAVRGFADRRLRVPENPLHFSNRRVTILLPYKWMEDRVLGSGGKLPKPIEAEIRPKFGFESKQGP